MEEDAETEREGKEESDGREEREAGVGGIVPMNLNRWRLGRWRARSFVRAAALPGEDEVGMSIRACMRVHKIKVKTYVVPSHSVHSSSTGSH